MADAIGWSELFGGDMIGAVYTMYTTYMGVTPIIVLFITYQFMLWFKTQSTLLMWVTGMIFASLYAVSVFVKPAAVYIIFSVLAFQLAGILYFLIFK